MSKSLEIVSPSPNQLLPISVVTEGIQWKWNADPFLYAQDPNISNPGFEFITPNQEIPHRYIGKIKMIIRDSTGAEVYSYTYDCSNSTFSNNEPGMYWFPQTGCISAPLSMNGQEVGSMNYWDPPKDKFVPGKSYYLQGEVETITDFDGGTPWCSTGSECTDLHPGGEPMTPQCIDYSTQELSDCKTGSLTDILYENDEGNGWGIPFEIENEVLGCGDSTANNYNPSSNKDDGSCTYDEKVEDEVKPWPVANEDGNDDHILDYMDKQGPDLQPPIPETPISATPAVGNVSNRMFGADMPLAVKRKLETRQILNRENQDPNKPITTMYKSDELSDQAEAYSINDPALGMNLQFGGDADLSSRTPFARMWTAVQIQNVINNRSWHKNEDKNYRKNKEKYRYETRNNRIYEKEVNRHERMVYMLGDANSNILDRSPTQTRDLNTNDSSVGGGIASKLLPYEGETNNNQFFKPPAGITSVSSETEGPLGAIRKTSVSFVVNNFHDFENIYSRYFLRPGAMVYIDFGWSSTPLYDPKELVYTEHGKSTDMEDVLYGPDGVVTKNAGDLEIFMGYVVDYSAKATENGTFECSLEIVSKNQALLGHSYKESKPRKNKMIASLDASILNYAAKHFGDGFLEPDKNYSTTDQQKFNNISYMWASEQLEGDTQPNQKESLLTGVFWKTLEINDEEGNRKKVPGDSKNIYISWGLFEDFILNHEFAIATDPDDAIQGKNLTVRFDSSNSFLHWDTNLQKMMAEDKITPFKFLYPSVWYNTYNTVRAKVPFDRIKPNGRAESKVSGINLEKYGTVGSSNVAKGWDAVDKEDHQRIPMREIFVSLQLIKEGMEKKDSVKDIITYILDGINEESRGIYDLQLSSNKKHMSESSIVDRNFVYSERMDSYNYLDKLFTFQPHSENSIVTDFSVNFTMPSNDMNAMIAIQGADAGTQIFPVDSGVDRVLAMNIQKFIGEDASLGIAYLPEVGNHRIDQIQKSISDGHIIDAGFFDASEALLGEDSTQADFLNNFNLDYKDTDNWDEMYKVNSEIQETEDSTTDSADENASTEVAAEEKEEYDDDIQLAANLSELYALKAKSNYFTERMSTVIPIEVELSIYGLGSINVGDIFRVDYLPKIYRDSVYFQTTKVSHDLDTSGWVTKLTTQMRISPTAKQKFPLYLKPRIYLSRNILNEYNLKTDGGIRWKGLENPGKYMREIELVKKGGKRPGNYLVGQFKFVATKNLNINKMPIKIDRHPAKFGAMSWEIKENYPSVTWKMTGKDGFKTWSEKVPFSAAASGFFAVWENYGIFYKIKLKAGNQYKLLISKCGGFVITPHDISDDQIDLINQGFYCMNRQKSSSGKYNMPRPSLARRVSQ